MIDFKILLRRNRCWKMSDLCSCWPESRVRLHRWPMVVNEVNCSNYIIMTFLTIFVHMLFCFLFNICPNIHWNFFLNANRFRSIFLPKLWVQLGHLLRHQIHCSPHLLPNLNVFREIFPQREHFICKILHKLQMLVDFSIQERICSISTWAHLRGSEASFLWKPAQSRWQEAGIQLGDHWGQGQAQSAFKGPWHLSPSPSPSSKPPWWQIYVKHFDIFCHQHHQYSSL